MQLKVIKVRLFLLEVNISEFTRPTLLIISELFCKYNMIYLGIRNKQIWKFLEKSIKFLSFSLGIDRIQMLSWRPKINHFTSQLVTLFLISGNIAGECISILFDLNGCDLYIETKCSTSMTYKDIWFLG